MNFAAIVRYLILSVQASVLGILMYLVLGAAIGPSGWRSRAADPVVALVFAAVAAVMTFALLSWRHASLKSDPERLAREAKWQWWWIGISVAIALLF
jgi:hypothetical protein